MRSAMLVLLLFAIPVYADSEVIEVPNDFTTIQSAIDAASTNDTVLVAPGTYVENIDFKGRGIIVTSSGGAGVTVIDGMMAGSVVTFSSGEDLNSILDGFTVTNGESIDGGGGIYCDSSSPTITYHINYLNFHNNWSNGGGGIYCRSSSPTITNNIISNNISAASGGGIYCHTSSPTIINNTILCNQSGNDGGGIFCAYSSPSITNNLIKGNYNSYSGGGVFCDYSSSPTITNNTIVSNMVHDWGGGICCGGSSSISITNNILWNNSADYGRQIFHLYTPPTVTYCDIQGGWPGVGNIDSDPLFVDSASNDFHLTFSSPCKDRGSNSTPYILATDFEGDPRIAYARVDMGADEFYTHLYHTSTASPGLDVIVKCVGTPGTTPVSLYVSTGLIDPPMPSIWGNWHLRFPVLGPINLGTIPSPDGILHYKERIPLTVSSGAILYLQALIGAKFTNLCVMLVN